MKAIYSLCCLFVSKKSFVH